MEQTIEKLLHQEFEQKMRGYDRDQVDDFLDEVVEDIEKLQAKYNLLLDEKKILEKNNFELKMKMLDLNERLSSPSAQFTQAPVQTPVADRRVDLTQGINIRKETPVVTKPANAPSEDTMQIRKPATPAPEPLGQAVTHEDSKANDFTLQDRIEQLEKELNNIKNFTE